MKKILFAILLLCLISMVFSLDIGISVLNQFKDFDLILRLSDNSVRGAIADSGWIKYSGSCVFDNSGFSLGIIGSILDGPYANNSFVAFYDTSAKLKYFRRYSKKELFFYYYFNPEYKEIYNNSCLINQDMTLTPFSEKDQSFYTSLIKNLNKKYQIKYDLYGEISFNPYTSVLLKTKDNIHSRIAHINKNGEIVNDINLDKFHFFKFMNSADYKNNPFEYIIFNGVLNNWIVITQGDKGILKLMNYKTGEVKNYNLRALADYYHLKGVDDYYYSENVEINCCVTNRNIYIILDSLDEKIILSYKL